jgi:hypothetical protein
MSVRDAGSKRDKSENPAPSRRRSFLATRQDEVLEAETLRIKAEVVDAFPNEIPGEKKDEDIPVLTEVVLVGETEDSGGEAPPDSPAPPPASPEAEFEDITRQMIKAIEQQLAYELPTLIEATLLSISADLRAGIVSTMQAALREFAARRAKAQPPDERDSL